MPEDTDQPQPASETVEPSPSTNAPASDAPPQRMPMPGESQILVGDEGLIVQTVTMPQVITIRADHQELQRIVTDYLTKPENRDTARAMVAQYLALHDEDYWDVIVGARQDVLRQRQKTQLSIVPDMKTARRVAKAKGLQA